MSADDVAIVIMGIPAIALCMIVLVMGIVHILGVIGIGEGMPWTRVKK